jgi:hypothetical protein
MGEVFQLRRPQLILSLCDRTGNWSRPYEEAGYEVVRVELEHGQDVRLLKLPSRPVHGIIAQPPCTVFANSGARWPRTDDDMREGLSVVDACCRIVLATQPVWWVLENPAGKLKHYLGPPTMTFQPNQYGDPYTKLTCLWGNFRPPAKNPVPATMGSKMHRLPPSPERAALRSVTPEGFARAFFEANA